MLKIIGSRTIRGPVGEPLNTDFAVRYTDAAKEPKAGVAVVFTCDPPGAVLFSGRQYATVNTKDKDEKGVASVVGTIQRPGEFTVKAETTPNDEDHVVTFDVHSVDPVGIHRLGGDTMVTHPWGGSESSRISWGAIAAMLAILVAGILLWKVIDKPSASSGGPIVVQQPGGGGSSNVDPVARADAQAALAKVDTAKQELGEAFAQGDAETLTHAEGYAREEGRPTARLAFLTARQVRERLTGGSGHSGGRPRAHICDRAPSTPGCH